MGDRSKISWTDATWNPIRGCSRVSEGCRNCYAERVAMRFSGPGQPYEGLAVRKLRVISDDEQRTEGRWTGEVRMVPEHLADPLRWKKPRRVFVNSMSDLFHERLTNEEIAAVFGVMAAARQHTFQVLTKRPERMREWFKWARRDFTDRQRGAGSCPHTFRAMLDAAFELLGHPSEPALDAAWRAHDEDVWPLCNVWIGVSVENQAAADERIPELLRTPAAVRFLSCEPLLGPVDVMSVVARELGRAAVNVDAVNVRDLGRQALHWLIAGCESGHGARAADVGWFRSLRDQCSAAGVPYFLKQAAHHHGGMIVNGIDCLGHAVDAGDGSHPKARGVIELPYLDGVQHAAFPEVRRG